MATPDTELLSESRLAKSSRTEDGGRLDSWYQRADLLSGGPGRRSDGDGTFLYSSALECVTTLRIRDPRCRGIG